MTLGFLFDIPEIVDGIVKHLIQKDQVTCLRVSRTFYAVVIPRIWETIGRSLRSNPSVEQLERNKFHIRHLELWAILPEYLALRGLGQLATLVLSLGPTSGVDLALAGLSDLIAAHSSTLQNITISLWRFCTTTFPKNLWSALAQCSRLSSVNISHGAISAESYSIFLQVCAKPSLLHLEDVNLSACSDSISGNSCVGPFLAGPKKVTITSQFMDGNEAHLGRNQGMMLRNFHGVKSLFLIGHQCEYNTALIVALSRDPLTLPSLESLRIRRSEATDGTLAGLLKQLPPLSALTIHDSHFGPLSLQALLTSRRFQPGGYSSQLYESLVTLHLSKCRNLTSAMVQCLLESCPKLTHFKATEVTVMDIARGQEWVCRDLRGLYVRFKADGQVDGQDPASKKQFAEMQRLVFKRLGKLTKLEELYINYCDHTRFSQMTTLDLRLEAGLDLLSGLINLRVFSVGFDHKQQMGVQEIIWITEHWKRLEHLIVRLNGPEAVVEEMESTLRASGIISTSP